MGKIFFWSLVEFMEQHLAKEEADYVWELRAVMTDGQIIQGLGLEGNKKFLPAIVYAMCMWKGEEKTMEWLATNVPPPIQMLFKKCWIHDFYENQLRVLEALTKDEEFTPATPSCDVCTLM